MYICHIHTHVNGQEATVDVAVMSVAGAVVGVVWDMARFVTSVFGETAETRGDRKEER